MELLEQFEMVTNLEKGTELSLNLCDNEYLFKVRENKVIVEIMRGGETERRIFGVSFPVEVVVRPYTIGDIYLLRPLEPIAVYPKTKIDLFFAVPYIIRVILKENNKRFSTVDEVNIHSIKKVWYGINFEEGYLAIDVPVKSSDSPSNQDFYANLPITISNRYENVVNVSKIPLFTDDLIFYICSNNLFLSKVNFNIVGREEATVSVKDVPRKDCVKVISVKDTTTTPLLKDILKTGRRVIWGF